MGRKPAVLGAAALPPGDTRQACPPRRKFSRDRVFACLHATRSFGRTVDAFGVRCFRMMARGFPPRARLVACPEPASDISHPAGHGEYHPSITLSVSANIPGIERSTHERAPMPSGTRGRSARSRSASSGDGDDRRGRGAGAWLAWARVIGCITRTRLEVALVYAGLSRAWCRLGVSCSGWWGVAEVAETCLEHWMKVS